MAQIEPEESLPGIVQEIGFIKRSTTPNLRVFQQALAKMMGKNSRILE
jgi:hypothetical protein